MWDGYLRTTQLLEVIEKFLHSLWYTTDHSDHRRRQDESVVPGAHIIVRNYW